MAQHRDPDRILFARLTAPAGRQRGRELTPEQWAEAVAELRELAGDRPDLLAERAGLAIGFGESRHDAARYVTMAKLCLAAGADESQIPAWIQEGRRRAELAAVIPSTSGPHHL